MNTRTRIVRLAALAFSLGLAATYVSCRSVGSSPDARTNPGDPPGGGAAPDPTVMYSTKSGPVVPPQTVQPNAAGQQGAAPAKRKMMSGSKSLAPLIEPGPAPSPKP